MILSVSVNSIDERIQELGLWFLGRHSLAIYFDVQFDFSRSSFLISLMKSLSFMIAKVSYRPHKSFKGFLFFYPSFKDIAFLYYLGESQQIDGIIQEFQSSKYFLSMKFYINSKGG